MKLKLSIMIFALSMILASLFMIQPVFASQGNQKILDQSNPFYFIKGFMESIELKLSKDNNQRIVRYWEFAEARMAEAKSLAGKNRADLIPPALEKYAKQLDKIAGLINVGDLNFKIMVVNGVGRNINTLISLQNNVTNPKAHVSIRAALSRLVDWNLQVLVQLNKETKVNLGSKIKENESALCNYLITEASSSALNTTEKFVITNRAQNCSQNLKLNSF